MPARRILHLVLGWVVAVTGGHLALNVDWTTVLNDWQPRGQRKFNVAFIPVT